MTIVSNSSALFPAPGASGSKANSMTDMGADDFLTLMVAQLQHQDPTKPMDNTEFVAQLAQFSTCLLYTSPSPRDSDSSRMPSSA